MNSEQIVNTIIVWIRGLSVDVVIKWMGVVGLLMYAIFALVVVKQVQIMTETVEDKANGVVQLVAWVHLIMTLVLIVIVVLAV